MIRKRSITLQKWVAMGLNVGISSNLHKEIHIFYHLVYYPERCVHIYRDFTILLSWTHRQFPVEELFFKQISQQRKANIQGKHNTNVGV